MIYYFKNNLVYNNLFVCTMKKPNNNKDLPWLVGKHKKKQKKTLTYAVSLWSNFLSGVQIISQKFKPEY